jgi:hypothetical protein
LRLVDYLWWNIKKGVENPGGPEVKGQEMWTLCVGRGRGSTWGPLERRSDDHVCELLIAPRAPEHSPHVISSCTPYTTVLGTCEPLA